MKKKLKRKNHARFQPVLTKKGTFQSLEHYQEKLKYNLTCKEVTPDSCFWGIISQLQSIEFGKLSTKEPLISLYALATSLYSCILQLPVSFPLFSKGATKFIANREFSVAASIDAEGVHADYYLKACSSDEKHEANILNIIWVICENSVYQGDVIYKVVNQLVLTGLIGFRNLPKDGFRTEQLFQKNLGVSAYDYFLSLFALWTAACHHGNINTELFIPSSPRKGRLDAACRSVLDEISLRYNDFSKKGTSLPFSKYSGKSIPLSLFSRWPMINLNDEIYACAGHPFMRIQLTSKLLSKALALARIEEGRPDTQYSQFVGQERFEVFFGELCAIWNPVGGYHEEYKYDRKSNSKSPDWIAFEKHGQSNVVHLFQLKLKALKEASHYGVSLDPISDDIKGTFSKLLSQSIKFLFALNNSAKLNNLNQSHESLSKRILEADKYTLIGVVPDLPSVFTISLLRERVIEGAEALLKQEELKWYQAHLKGKFHWHIMELPEFQVFITLAERHRDFYKALTKYLRDSQIDNFVIDSSGSLPRDFRSYLISKFGEIRTDSGDRKLKNYQNNLWSSYEGVCSDVNNYFFGKLCT